MSGSGDIIGSDDTVTAVSVAARRPAGAALEPGTDFGRYEIIGMLGQGGMGVVYEARDPDLDRRVAIKLLRGTGEGDGEARLLREARAMARLSHPNVITVFEVGTIAGDDFVAMEFVDGQSLDVWLTAGDRPWPEILEVMVGAGRGLAAAHDAGLIHRDFKPANVLVAADGRVLVTDFGLARDVASPDDDRGASVAPFDAGKLTMTGAVLGTPAYMAPEQHQGETADDRTDQFNYCVSLYEAMYGIRPFRGDNLDELGRAVLAGPPPPPADSAVPAAVRTAILRGLETNPRDRHRSMRALLDALTRGLDRGRGRIVATIAAATIIVSGAVATYAAWPERAAPSTDCAQAASLFDEAWSGQRAEVVRATFARADGDASYRTIAAALDARRREWIAAYEGTCGQREQIGDEQFHGHVACLLGYRARVRAFVDEFARADAAMVEQAVAATAELGAPAACIASGAASSPPPAPDDPELRARVRAIRTELSSVEALERSASGDEVLARATELLERARTLDYQPLVAEVLYRQANAQSWARDYDGAKATFREAVLVAEESGHVEVRARALVDLLQLYVEYTSDVDESRVLARRASAAIDAYSGELPLRAQLHTALARIAGSDRNYDNALRELAEAERLYEAAGARGGVSSVLWLRGEIFVDQGKYAEAVAVHRRRLETVRELLGERHPDTALAMEATASALRFVREYDEARRLYDEAAVILGAERTQALFDRGYDIPSGDRVVRGRVVDGSGATIEGAEIVACLSGMRGDGKYAFATFGAGWERRVGIRKAWSGPDGTFTLRDVVDGSVYVVAEHSDVGRTGYVELRDDIELVLRPFGTLRGSVTGDLPSTAHLHVTPGDAPEGADARLEIWPDADGTYIVDRLPAGEHLVNVLISDNNAMNIATFERVTVAAGETTTLDLAADFGGISVTVVVRSEAAGAITGAGVALFRGRLDEPPTNGRELITIYTGALRQGIVKMGFTEPRPGDMHEVVLPGFSPGLHTLCAAPIRGDIKDPNVYDRLLQNAEKLAVVCHEVTLEPGDRATLDIEVPGMPRIP